MNNTETILRVAVATPLRQLFDYLPASNNIPATLKAGQRVSVPFGNRTVTGIIVALSDHSDFPLKKLKHIKHVVDEEPIIDDELLKLIKWASRYYHHPIGDVIFNALPIWLRGSNRVEKLQDRAWRLTGDGESVDLNSLQRAPKQAQLINYLRQYPACYEAELLTEFPGSKPVLARLIEKNWIIQTEPEISGQASTIRSSMVVLNDYQKNAIDKITAAIDINQTFLLDGLTGSGKTEVYMAAIEHAMCQGKQSLVLLPEIGLTPQIIQRFQERFDCHIAVQHSGLSDMERARYWNDARNGKALIVLGTRSAVWTPLAKPGLFIIDEEHDLSYKQQDGLRYSARDTLVIRANHVQVPVVLGSATPSLESMNNAVGGRYEHLLLPARAGNANPPEYKVVDIRGRKMHGALSQTLIDEMRKHLDDNNQVLLFLNRRGYANNLLCHVCGWNARCERCDIPFTYHKATNRLICHHCDSQRRSFNDCPECGESLILLGHGTERIEEVLQEQFPDQEISRIDRDTTRKKKSFEELLERVQQGKTNILVGTQMLAKGHHFPDVTLTAIIDADRGLFSTDFRATERLAQLFMQVSGRTGRGNKTGTVLVQTHQPEHPLFQQLIREGYARFATTELREREAAELPPYTYMALLTAETNHIEDCKQFLQQAGDLLGQCSNYPISRFGPIPALIEKRSGRYRWQLVLQANSRKHLHTGLDNWIMQLETLKLSKKVRWALDIDPLDMA